MVNHKTYFFVPCRGPVFRCVVDDARAVWYDIVKILGADGMSIGFEKVAYDRTRLEAPASDGLPPTDRIYFYRERGIEQRFALAKLLDPEAHGE